MERLMNILVGLKNLLEYKLFFNIPSSLLFLNYYLFSYEFLFIPIVFWTGW